MFKKIISLIAAAAMAVSFVGCSEKNKGSESSVSSSSEQSADENSASDESSAEENSSAETEEPTEAETTAHISPAEQISVTLGTQTTPNATIKREDGSNTYKIPLSDFIQDGDIIDSFTFIIYSGDGKNIGTFKGGCGISVESGCAAATDEGWFQSADFSASTQGTYGEIKWSVPAEIRDYISAGGDVMFGYWWGNASSIRLDTAVCTFTRTASIPCDGTADVNIGKSVSYSDDNNKVGFKISDAVPSGNVPQAVTFNISSGGKLGKFTGAFSVGSYQSQDIAVFTDGSNLSLTWILPDEARNAASEDSEIMLGYWWSEQNSINLDSASVKYSVGELSAVPPEKSDSEESTESAAESTKPAEKTTAPAAETPEKPSNSKFRSSSEIVGAMTVGWNLGNTLDCYDFASWTTDGETAWGNVKTTREMIQAVKKSGFNAIRIPVTWGDHMNGNTIDSAWMSRVKEVVDYAYDEGMFVILNMHHDDYTWFAPSEAKYQACSEKLCAIWKQISATFKDYGDTLLFEGMNEPRTVGSAAEWSGGTSAERSVINKYEQDFIKTVRASGGNNSERTLIITSYAASAETAAVNDVAIPNDNNIIVSVHYYAPWKFADGQSTVFGDSEKSELDAKFSYLNNRFVSSGIPVIIGEFGCVKAASDDVRSQYYEYYIKSAKNNGIKCFIWDNGVESGEGAYGLFNRTSKKWNETILKGIMNGAK